MTKSVKKHTKNITFVIRPTEFKDYDILAIGDLGELLAFKKNYHHLIKKSQFGGISILVIDTCDTLSGAKGIISEYITHKPLP